MKKKIGLLVVLVICFISFVPTTNAVVMWMDCGKINEDPVDLYFSTKLAVLNNINGGGLRHLIYDTMLVGDNPDSATYGNSTFFMYDDIGDGHDKGNLCWYNEWYDDDWGSINDCDREEDRVAFSELLNGNCPANMGEITDGLFTDKMFATVSDDFMVGWGIQKASKTEELNNSILVIYGVDLSGDEANLPGTGVVVESYYVDGRYSYASTIDFDAFSSGLGLEENDTDWALIDEDEYDTKFMNWAMQSQARRVINLQNNYFKLLDTQEAWLVSISDDSNYTVSNLDGIASVYRSDDGENEGFGKWVKNWYQENAAKLSKQFEVLEKFNSGGEYYKLINVSQEISDKIDEGKKYSLGNDTYVMDDMVNDLNNAYLELSELLDSEDIKYVSYNDGCVQDSTLTSDAGAAALSAFNCSIFGVPEISDLSNSENPDLADAIIADIISSHIQRISGSEISIDNMQKQLEKYSKLFAKSSNYIKKNIYFSDEETINLIDNLSDDYQNLVREKFNVEIVLDCESLIGEDLRKKINSYLDIIKIAIPLILIGFGVIDFTKAIFAGDDDKMKKAQKTFVKRIGIAILIFIVPTIVNLLLSLANKVWNFIEPDSCGLFETRK